MNNTNQMNAPCAVDVTVVKRGRNLQFVASLTVLGVIHMLETRRLLTAGKKTPDEALEAFMGALTAGNDSDSTADEEEVFLDCFAAMEDNLDIDATAELQEAIDSGSQALIAQARELVNATTLAVDSDSELEPIEFVIGQIEVIEPPEGLGICSVCLKQFNLHYIAGTTDLCMSHINPGFI